MELGWIHFNRDDRNRVFNALKALEENDALDELGIGKIRDYFSNEFFPGITTNQTRAHYYIFLSNMFEDALKNNFSSTEEFHSTEELQNWLDEQQDNLVDIFLHKKYPDKKWRGLGIIGIQNKDQGKPINQKPLSIYWSGLYKYGIIRDENAFYQNVLDYIDQKNAIDKQKKSIRKKDGDYEPDEILERDSFFPETGCWTKNWISQIDMETLSKNEANFLYNRITESCPDSLLTLILKYYKKHPSKIDLRNKITFKDFSNISPNILDQNPEIKKTYDWAIQFRNFYYGCQLAYAYLVTKDEADEENYLDWLNNKQEWENVPLDDILGTILDNSSVDKRTKDFLKKAREYAVHNNQKAFEELIRRRESALKGVRAKIGKEDKYKPSNKLDYRASAASRIIQDILKGLK